MKANHTLRIAMIGSRGLWSNYGGLERCLTELGGALAQRGHEVDVFSEPELPVCRDGLPNLRNVPTHCLPGRNLETITRSLNATLSCVRRRYDIIHYHAAGSAIFSPLGRIIAPTVLTFHGLDWQRAKWGALAKSFLYFSARVGARMTPIVSISSADQIPYFRSHFGIEPILVPNATPEVGTSKPELLAQFGLTRQRYALFATRLVKEKAADELIRAFNTLDTDIRLVIAGSNHHDRDYVNWLHSLADPKKIIFVGLVKGDVLNTLFAESYCFVHCSHLEGRSMAVLEAMAFGVPALVSDIPDNLDVIGENGFCFRTGDVDDLARQLTFLFDRPDVAAECRDRLRKFRSTSWTWIQSAEKYEHLYRLAYVRQRSLTAPRFGTKREGAAVTKADDS